jgi:hypothetical protein
LLDLSNLLEVRERAALLQQPLSCYPLNLEAEQLRPIAVGLTNTPDAPVAGRVTALQVCVRRGFAEVLPTARQIVANNKEPFMLRLVAINALGQFGDSGDEAILQKVLGEGNTHLRKAALPALKRLQQRQSS